LAESQLLSEQEEDSLVDLVLQRNASVLTLLASFDTSTGEGATPIGAKAAARLSRHLRRRL
jgi:hypothetical protein